jgi:hypothetical protein
MGLNLFKLTVVCFLLLPVLSFAQDKFDFYISNSGSDGYPGNMKLLPRKTIIETAPLLKNYSLTHNIVKLGLKSGDVFEDNLVTSYPIQVGTYSDNSTQNDFAILNGSKEFNEGWIKKSGTENTFEQAIPYQGFVGYGINGIGSYSYIYVTEIDKALEKTAPFTARKPLEFVTSLADLEKTPGSFYSPVNTNENPKQVFLHTSNGSSPNANATYRYEVTVRDWAINSTYQSNNTFENLWVRGFGAGNGILPGGDNSYYNKIVFGPGAGIHHMVLRAGSINHSLFLPGPKNTNDFAVVFYDVEGLNRHCTIKNSMFLDIGSPVYAHTSLGTNFGAVEIDNVVAFTDNSAPGGFMFTSNNDSVILNNVYANGYYCGYNYGSAQYASIKNSYFKDVSFGIAFSPKNPVAALVDNVFIKTKTYGQATGIYMQSNTLLKLTNSIIHVINKNNQPASFVYGGALATSKIVSTGNIFICDVNASQTINAANTNTDNGMATSSDRWNNNVYILLNGKKIGWTITNPSTNGGNRNLQNFDEWKKQSGQDKNSLFFDLRNDPRGLKAIFADPDNGNYDLANTVEGAQIAALRAGMTSPITCFLGKPSYEEAANLIRNNQVLSINACRNPCQQNSIRINATFDINPINDRQVKLKWNIGEQQNIDHYELQKATGNSVFKKLSTIRVSADSIYSFVDNIQAGIPYQYRLAIIPLGVGKCYSDARQIKINDDKAFTIYPNPSSGKIQVSMNGYIGKASFIVSNSDGQKILKKEIFSLYFTQSLDLSNYPKGLYFLKMETSKGVSVQKFVLQ